jgi:hypothetical protein
MYDGFSDKGAHSLK